MSTNLQCACANQLRLRSSCPIRTLLPSRPICEPEEGNKHRRQHFTILTAVECDHDDQLRVLGLRRDVVGDGGYHDSGRCQLFNHDRRVLLYLRLPVKFVGQPLGKT
jgi:hypothetical protein